MNPTLIGVIGILVLILVFFSRMPVAYVMTMVGYVGFSYLVNGTAGLKLLSRDFYEVYSSYGLTIIPMFVFMGQIAFNAGISRRLYDSAYAFVGAYRADWRQQPYVPARLLVRLAAPARRLPPPWRRWVFQR